MKWTLSILKRNGEDPDLILEKVAYIPESEYFTIF